jgi:hypothetical protein
MGVGASILSILLLVKELGSEGFLFIGKDTLATTARLK